MKFHEHSRRFDLDWLIPPDEEHEFEQVDALFEKFRAAKPEGVASQSRDDAIEHLYTEGGIFCPLCGAVFHPEGAITP